MIAEKNSLIIDMDKNPRMPFDSEKLRVKTHIKSGKIDLFTANIDAINVLRTPENFTTGHEFLKRLGDEPVLLLNANIIDKIIEKQIELSFFTAERQRLYFAFGTVYVHERWKGEETEIVRYCYKSGARWFSAWTPLNRIQFFHRRSYALVIRP